MFLGYQEIFKDKYIIPIANRMNEIEFIINNDIGVIILGKILNIMNMERIVDHIRTYQKETAIIIDIDMVGGLDHDEHAVNFISKRIKADGLISTNRSVISQAKSKELLSIFKIFLHDEFSVRSGVNNIESCRPDVIEVVPGIASPFLIKALKKSTYRSPVHVSGFINNDIDGVISLFKNGVDKIHSSNKELYSIQMQDRLQKML